MVKSQALLTDKQFKKVTSLQGTNLTDSPEIYFVVVAILGSEHLPVNWQQLPWLVDVAARQTQVLENVFAGCYIDPSSEWAKQLPPIHTTVAKPKHSMLRPSYDSVIKISRQLNESSPDMLFYRGLETDSGQDWLKSKPGRIWLNTFGGLNWINSENGLIWLDSTAGQHWYYETSPVAFGDLLRTARDYYRFNGSLCKLAKEWAKSADGLSYLAIHDFSINHPVRGLISADEWKAMTKDNDITNAFEAAGRLNQLAWVFTPDGFDWLATPAGQRLLSRIPFKNYADANGLSFWKLFNVNGLMNGWWLLEDKLPMLLKVGVPNVEWFFEIGLYLNTLIWPQGQSWLETPRGRAWMNSARGRFWITHTICSPSSETLAKGIFKEWFDSADCWWWTQTEAGINWLFTAPGQQWIATHPLRSEWQRQAGQPYIKAIQEQHSRDLKSRQLDAGRIHEMNIEQLREELNRQEDAKRLAEKEAKEEQYREQQRKLNEEAAHYEQMQQQAAYHQQLMNQSNNSY